MQDESMLHTQEPIPEETLQKRLPKRELGFAFWASVALVAFLGLPTAAYLVWVGNARRAFDRAVTNLESQNLPASVQGLDQFYANPQHREDTTALWLKVIRAVEGTQFKTDSQGLPFLDSVVGEPSLMGKPELQSVCRAFLDKYSSALNTAHLAAQRGGAARYPIEFADGYLALLSHVQELYNVVGLLRLQAHLLAVEGDAGGAVQALQTGFAAANSLEQEPIIVSQMARFHWITRLVQSVESLLAEVDFSDQQLESIQDTLRATEVRQSTTRAFVGEQGLSLVAFRGAGLKQLREMGQIDDGREYLLSLFGSRHEDLTLYTKFMERIVAASELPWQEAMTEVESVGEAATEATSGRLREIRYALTKVCLATPNHPFQTIQRAASAESLLRIADALVAVRRHEMKHGELPDSLDILVPAFLEEVPLDPLGSSAALMFQREGDTVSIYSVGINGRDDQGDETETDEQPADIVLRLTASPARDEQATTTP